MPAALTPTTSCGAGFQLAEQQKFDDAGAMFRSCAELATTDEQRGHAKDMLATTLMDRGHEMGDEDALGMYKQAWDIWTKELHVDPGNDNLVRQPAPPAGQLAGQPASQGVSRLPARPPTGHGADHDHAVGATLPRKLCVVWLRHETTACPRRVPVPPSAV